MNTGKRIISLSIIMVLLFVMLSGSVVAGSSILAQRQSGDVDGNQLIDLKDAQAVLKIALKIKKPTDEELKYADVDQNGSVDLKDAQIILKKALKIIKDDTSNPSVSNPSEAKKYYELTGNAADKDISIVWALFGGKDEYYQHYWEEMKGLKAIQEKTGVTIEFVVMEGYEDYLPLMYSKNYPDVITAKHYEQYSGRMVGIYEKGISVRLNEYMKDWMPNFSKLVEEYPDIARDLKLEDGSYTFVSSLYDVNNENDRTAASQYGLAIRKDWLDTLGYEIPTTIDQWHEVLLGFKQNDMNKDGILNEEPVCMASSGWKYFLSAYGIDDNLCIMKDENGNEKVVYGFASDNYKEYLAEMQKWYSEGLIYNMFENTSLEKRMERVTGNYAGAWKGDAIHFDETLENSYISMLRRTVPEAEFAAVPWAKTATGYQWCFSDIASFDRDITIITDNAKKYGTDKAAAYVIDYMLGEEGSAYINWGIEGESYVVQNNQKQFTDEMNETINFYGKTLEKKYTYADPITIMLPQFGEVSDYIIASKSEDYVNACETWSKGDCNYKISKACQLNPEQQKAAERYSESIKLYVSKMRNRFVTGKVSLTEYDAYVEQLQKMGVKEYEAIWEEAYTSYKNR